MFPSAGQLGDVGPWSEGASAARSEDAKRLLACTTSTHRSGAMEGRYDFVRNEGGGAVSGAGIEGPVK